MLAGAFGFAMLGFTLVGLLMSQAKLFQHMAGAASSAQLGFGLAALVLLVLYLVAVRTVFAYERDHAVPAVGELGAILPTLRRAVVRLAVAACVVAGAGVWLPFVATDLAHAMAWNKSFVGSLFVAMATSLPELAVTLSALHIGVLVMAIGNLLGSNLSPAHAVTAGSAITMTGLAMVGLFSKPGSRVLRAVGWFSLGLVAKYLLNTYVLFLHGE